MMTKPFLVIQHIQSEDPGVFAECLRRRKIETSFRCLFRSDEVPRSAVDFCGMLIMGGPMNVEEKDHNSFLQDEIELILDCSSRGLPVLGICLGSQLIASAFGAAVYDGPVKEIGWYPVNLTHESSHDYLFQDFPRQLTVFQWHGQTFDLPTHATLLAESDNYPHQAFQIGKNVYGLQFHLETTSSHVRKWLKENEAEVASLAYIDPAEVLRGIEIHENNCRKLALTLFDRFLNLAFK